MIHNKKKKLFIMISTGVEPWFYLLYIFFLQKMQHDSFYDVQTLFSQQFSNNSFENIMFGDVNEFKRSVSQGSKV